MLRRKCDLAAGRRDMASLSLKSNFIISRVVNKYYLSIVPITFCISTQRLLLIKEVEVKLLKRLFVVV